MDKEKENNTRQPAEARPADAEKHNPFKEPVANDTAAETPEEEAAAEQQRKEALTERD